MLRYLLAFVMAVHGIIHLMGFAKAFGYGNMTQLTKDISKPAGMLWLIAAVGFVVATALFLLKKESWPVIALAAVILSQVLIVTVWKDAKFGTLANVIILLAATGTWTSQRFEAQFRQDVQNHLHRTHPFKPDILTEADLQHLPPPVQKYLRYAGVLNKPKVKNVRIVFDG
ncbi:MAG: hypothetical protein MUD08_05955, partial [Cytophagales bacterium]|nr:hypothetical protein [Cytophagales bacterium]